MYKRKPELGKHMLWLLFHKHASIRPYLPATARFSKKNFEDYLRRYKMVYVKPSGGSRGVGIYRVWMKDKVYVKKTIQPPKVFSRPSDAWKYLQSDCRQKYHVVQQGIHLATIGDRPFDIRVMVQRIVPRGEWKYSGMLAKVAGKSSIVTNVALSRGSVLDVETALRRAFGWNNADIARRVSEMRRLAIQSANHFDTYQPYRELGFDMAIDKRGRLWLIEENTGPSHLLFRKLKSDLSMYRRIQYRWGQYQRGLQNQRTRHQRRL